MLRIIRTLEDEISAIENTIKERKVIFKTRKKVTDKLADYEDRKRKKANWVKNQIKNLAQNTLDYETNHKRMSYASKNERGSNEHLYYIRIEEILNNRGAILRWTLKIGEQVTIKPEIVFKCPQCSQI